MGGRKAWSTTIPTGSCWGLFGGALTWAPTATIDVATSGRPPGNRLDTGSSEVVVIIDLAGAGRGAPPGSGTGRVALGSTVRPRYRPA